MTSCRICTWVSRSSQGFFSTYAFHAASIFLFASNMATDSSLLERVVVAFETQNEAVLKEIYLNLKLKICKVETLSEKDHVSRLGKSLRRNMSVECYIPDKAKKNPLVPLRYIYLIYFSLH